MQESPNRAEEPNSNNAATPAIMDFHKSGESSRKCRKISHEKMSSRLKEPQRKGIFMKKMERLYKITQNGKKALTKLSPKRRLVQAVSKVLKNSYCTEKC